MSKSNRKTSSSYSLPVRIVAIALAVLTASGILTFLVTLLLNLFGAG